MPTPLEWEKAKKKKNLPENNKYICSHRETQLKFGVFLMGRAPINRQKIPMLVAFKALTTYF